LSQLINSQDEIANSLLPIVEVLDTLRELLQTRDELVLQAPPGAGKTTMVPLALLNEPWLAGRKILMLEPRRIAAKAAATRMAQMLGEAVGETVGYRIRLDQCVGANTRIEVLTEGILTRRLQSDPALEDVGLLIFDEFHERNLNSDFGLALSLQGREVFREGSPLKMVLMSATIDGEAVAKLLDDAPVVTSAGRQFPVTASYGKPYSLRGSIVGPTVEAIVCALEDRSGSILVFLPGQGEIAHVTRELASWVTNLCDDMVMICPLYGGLSLVRQQEAIEPAPKGVRKVVLATNIAETSLTIEGVEVVIDSGLVREAIYDSATGMTRLDTRRVSRSSAEQRSGRAGRLGPGHCYRLWSEEQHRQLVAHSTPEILQADLGPVALQLMAWGVSSPSELKWLDAPNESSFAQAQAMLKACGAVTDSERGTLQLSDHGQVMAKMPLHPRLAHMLLVGCNIGALETAALLAALLSERNPLNHDGAEILRSLAVLTDEVSCQSSHRPWYTRTRKQAKRYSKLVRELYTRQSADDITDSADIVAVLLANAYPERVAKLKSRSDCSQYQLANGRRANLSSNDSLAGCEWLAVAEVGGRTGQAADRIYTATALNEKLFSHSLLLLVNDSDYVQWEDKLEKYVAERRRMVGQIILSSKALTQIPEEARLQALLDVVRKRGLSVLPWTKALQQWQSRVVLLHQFESDNETSGNRWPDLSDNHLLKTLESWLAPYLNGVHRLNDFQKIDLKSILASQLSWPLPLELERLAPERYVVPSGSNISVDYSQNPPVLEVKLQEMFGCEETPSIVGGRLPLVVHLMSPAQRPLQITQDLAGFWRSSYHDIKKEMKGRYPKHPWPDDPLGAEATRYTKQRLAEQSSKRV
jgi:ATP-dependent helicase HrpB